MFMCSVLGMNILAEILNQLFYGELNSDCSVKALACAGVIAKSEVVWQTLAHRSL